jgi:hypothetical protein
MQRNALFSTTAFALAPLLAQLSFATSGCSGPLEETKAARLTAAAESERAAPEIAPTLNSTQLASIQEQLTRGVWTTQNCGDACNLTELRFASAGKLEERSGHSYPGGSEVMWSEIVQRRYSISASGVVAIEEAGQVATRATFVADEQGWAALGFRASAESPQRYRHESFASYGAEYPTRGVRTELIFDADLGDRSKPCAASLRVQAQVTIPREEPETLTLEGRLPCRVEHAAARTHVVFEDSELGGTEASAAWSAWWERRMTPRTMAMRDALNSAMTMVLVVDSVELSLRGEQGSRWSRAR